MKVILTLNFLVSVAFCRTGFVKDQNENLVEFPPRTIQPPGKDIPVGHLRPIGWHRVPEGRVEELETMLHPQLFHKNYVQPRTPVVFRKVLEDVPAMTSWKKDEYLRQKYGEIDIHVVVKKEIFKSGPKQIKFKKFLKEYLYEDWYLSNYVPLEMMSDLTLPLCLRCGYRRWLMESEIWMSSGGTSSTLHSHADHDLHCLLAGRKDFVLIENKYKIKLAYQDKFPYKGAGRSEMDTDRINMFKYHQVSEVPWIWSTLRAGDCIFVPAGYIHHVRSYGRSISSTNHFSPTPVVSFKDCDKTDINETIPLSTVHYLWTYTNGKLLLSNSRLSAPSMKHHLLMVMRDNDDLSYDLFKAFYLEVMQEAENYINPKTVWSFIAAAGKTSLLRTEVKKLSKDALEQVADAFNLPHQQLAKKSPKHIEL